jgi:ribosomal protein S18 acetylase RimI-like enzyme
MAVTVTIFTDEYDALSAWTGHPAGVLRSDDDADTAGGKAPDRRLAWDGDRLVGVMQLWHRPDGRTGAYFGSHRPEPAAFGPSTAAVDGELWVNVSGVEQPLLESAGFAVARRELLYRVPVSRFEAPMPDGLRTVAASTAAAEPLAHLDAALRRDVPGSEDWQVDIDDFNWQTFGDQFDPELYRIAMDGDRMVGLVRIWAGPRPVPRLGLIGVLRDYRRIGLARALVGEAFAVLVERGVPFVTCEADETNVGSRALLEGLGAQTIGVDVEMRRAG